MNLTPVLVNNNLLAIVSDSISEHAIKKIFLGELVHRPPWPDHFKIASSGPVKEGIGQFLEALAT